MTLAESSLTELWNSTPRDYRSRQISDVVPHTEIGTEFRNNKASLTLNPSSENRSQRPRMPWPPPHCSRVTQMAGQRAPPGRAYRTHGERSDTLPCAVYQVAYPLLQCRRAQEMLCRQSRPIA